MLAQGSWKALPAFLRARQSKHGVNSALHRLVAVSGCAPGVAFHPSQSSSCAAERGSAVSRIQSVQITGVPVSNNGGKHKNGENPN